jgi:hypothetical protein
MEVYCRSVSQPLHHLIVLIRINQSLGPWLAAQTHTVLYALVELSGLPNRPPHSVFVCACHLVKRTAPPEGRLECVQVVVCVCVCE